jgi:hypothetical protein
MRTWCQWLSSVTSISRTAYTALTFHKTFASNVDEMANINVDDPNARQFLQHFFKTGNEGETDQDARTSLLSLSRYPNTSHKYTMQGAHVVFRYRLLDIVADALDIPRSENVSAVEQRPIPDFKVERLDKV